MTPAQAKRLRRFVNRLARAEVDHSWRGAQDPRDVKEIITERNMARHAFDTYITYLVEKGKA